MAQRTEVYFICDCCGAEGTDDMFTQPVWLPARKYDSSGKKFIEGFAQADLCVKCSARFWKISDEQFVTFEVIEFNT